MFTFFSGTGVLCRIPFRQIHHVKWNPVIQSHRSHICMNCACGMFLFFQVLNVILNMLGTFFLCFAVVLLTAELNEFVIVLYVCCPCYVVFVLLKMFFSIVSELA